MVRLKRLKMRAFRSFAGEVEVDFPPSGLLLIRGLNSATGESSGTGKSSILLGIAYALGTCPFPATDLQSWGSTEPLQVKLTLETPRGEATITRGKTSRLEAEWLPRAITSAKGVTEELQRIFGVESDTLRAITYRPQKEPGLFLSLTDGDKKEFLTRILGLAKFEQRADEATMEAKSLKAMIDGMLPELQIYQQQLDGFLNQKIPEQESEELYIRERARLQDGLASIKKQIDETLTAAENVVVEDDEFLKALRLKFDATLAHANKLTDAHMKAMNEFRDRREKLQQQLQAYVATDTQKVQLVAERQRLEKERQEVLAGRCFTCNRPWDGSAAKAAELEARIANIDARVEGMKNVTILRVKTEEALRETFPANPLIRQFQDLMNKIEKQIQGREYELRQAPKDAALKRVNQLQVLRAETRAKLEGCERQLEMVQQTNVKFKQMREQLESNIAIARMKVETHQAEMKKLTERYGVEADFASAMGYQGFLGAIFSEVLQDIETRTNDRLAKLANVSHVTLRFKTESIDAAGKVNRTIVPLAYVNGHETKLKSGLSGGMYTSVEGIVDLAVMAVAQERTGTLPGFLMLDESFEGQGNVTKEAAMEVLREYGQEKLVIVVDHSSEIKEIFTQFIDVQQDASGVSVIQ